MELSKLSRDMLIEILLKTNKWEYYKISVIGREFYIKCRSKDEVIKIIVENDDIRCAIIKFWEIFDDDIDILINSNTGEIIFYSYHCSGTPSKDWRSILFDEDFKSTIVPRFSEILKYWFETELKGISIEKIDMIS